MNTKPKTASSPTLRAPVNLPAMPLESQVHQYPPIEMARSRLLESRLVFDHPDGFEQARRHGFFLLEVPARMDFCPGDLFVRNCFLPRAEGALSTYTGFKECQIPGAYQGYFDREHDQWENVYIERGNWSLIPEAVAALGVQMAELGIGVLRAVLAELDIPRAEWARLTSGLSEGQGHQMFGFNHFRASKPIRGSKFHRDSGWVTVLRSTEPGLIAYIDGASTAAMASPAPSPTGSSSSSHRAWTWQPAIPSPATSTCLARRASARPTRVSRSGPKIGWRAGKDISPATSTRSSSSSSRADSGRQCSQALCCGRPNGCGVSVSRCCGPYSRNWTCR